MENITQAMQELDRNIGLQEQGQQISFEAFLKILAEKPDRVIRNVFQVYHDMVKSYTGSGKEEEAGVDEINGYPCYDCNRLFVEGTDRPFFADRLFANRFMARVESMRSGAQQNKIYIFDGPPGCGKSTFLNILLKKFEEYANTEAGMRYETVWRLDRSLLSRYTESDSPPAINRLLRLLADNESLADESYGSDWRSPENSERQEPQRKTVASISAGKGFIDVPCPSHDNPILIIPKPFRRAFFDALFKNDEIKWRLYTEKEYEWMFQGDPCTICSTMYDAFQSLLPHPLDVFKLVYARPYRFNRRLGEGISVFNPGDRPLRQYVLTNPILQRQINSVFKGRHQIQYIFSRYAKTNNGIYALMDIKSHNTDRLIELHNIISEGVHKVEDLEENVDSLFLAVMNPEDRKNVQNFQSFSDRIEYINIPYVLDLNTEVEIYRNIFGRHIDDAFLPRVLLNFARVIISSRLNTRSDALMEWIGDAEKYKRYCDKYLQLLKMEIYMGSLPSWLSEEDRKRFTKKRRRKILAESESEGQRGFSGRESIKIFNQFYTTFTHADRLINMDALATFFTKIRTDLHKQIPEGFMDSMRHLYDYKILQEVKESLYYYNEDQISRAIQNYMFALNFEPGSVETSRFTGDRLEISASFFEAVENRLLGAGASEQQRQSFRKDTQREYTSRTLTQEIMLADKDITATRLYQDLYKRYVYNLKEKVLDPFLENENFRRAIKDYDSEDFKSYDNRIQEDVTFLINNLCQKYGYTDQGANEVCMYVIDNDLARQFSNS